MNNNNNTTILKKNVAPVVISLIYIIRVQGISIIFNLNQLEAHLNVMA